MTTPRSKTNHGGHIPKNCQPPFKKFLATPLIKHRAAKNISYEDCDHFMLPLNGNPSATPPMTLKSY